MQVVLCFSLQRVELLCVNSWAWWSTVLSCVTTSMNSPPFRSTLTSVASQATSSGMISQTGLMMNCPNALVSLLWYSENRKSIFKEMVGLITMFWTIIGFRYTLRTLHREQFYLPDKCSNLTAAQIDTAKKDFCCLLNGIPSRSVCALIDCEVDDIFLQCAP